MGQGRRVVRVIVVIVLAAALLPATTGRAQEACDHGFLSDPGPICAELSPPLTIYEVLDARPEGTDVDVYWQATLACGRWYPGVNGVTFEGEPLQKDEFFATWSHNNSPHPDSCSHDAPDHPGTIVADVLETQRLLFIPLAGRTTRCTYDKGSASGVSPVCVTAGSQPSAQRNNAGNAGVMTGGAPVVVSASGSDVRVDFPGGEASPLVTPQNDLTSLSILGVSGPDDITIFPQGLENTFFGGDGKIGINGVGGNDTVTIDWGDGTTETVTLGPVPATEQVPDGGFTIDLNQDGTPDIGTTNTNLVLNTGDGNDRATFVRELYQQLLKRPANSGAIDFLGGLGNDTVVVEGSDAANKFTLGGLPASTSVPDGGIGIDFGSNNTFDLNGSQTESFVLNLLGGKDTLTVQVDELYRQFLNRPAEVPPLQVDGGVGTDSFKIQENESPRPTDRVYFSYNYFGSGTSAPRVAQGQTSTAHVNLNGADDDLVDVIADAIEKWTAVGTSENDLFSGAGGHGTGDPFTFPLAMFGEGGNDKLTGGTKADVIDGGRGKKDVCIGGKGKDSALGCETVRSIP